jgi:hypothetical protein
MSTIMELQEVATCVEERFARHYRMETVASAKTESQMEFELVSTGWWLAIARLGLALWVSNEKPAIQTGDTIRITISKRMPNMPKTTAQASGIEVGSDV